MTERKNTPPRYKTALLTWVGAYGAISAILYELGPLMATWPLLLRTLVISVLMVVTLTWLVIPLLTRLFRSWLLSEPRRAERAPRRTARPQLNALGTTR
jgi:antibiotic biosynthesis monooxygenase (ABM) superfamily enzyme